MACEQLAHANTLPHDLWQWLWRHLDCYDLPANGVNNGKGKSSHHITKHKKAQRWDTGTSSVVIPPQMMECLNKTECKQIQLLLWYKMPALYYAWGEEYYENPKNAGQLDPPRMLDTEHVKYWSLKTTYLVACSSDASMYSLTNSPEWLHGGLWYFQLPQLFMLANSINVMDKIKQGWCHYCS